MITETVIGDFESLWRRRGIFHVDLTYGQALAQFTKCELSHPDSIFLATAPYPTVRAWIEGKVDANKKIQTQASDNPSNLPSLPNAH